MGEDTAGEVALDRIGVVIIGRNEAASLPACLASIPSDAGRVVYVDSNSTDGSAAVAGALGADVVELSGDEPVTAARARDAGLRRLLQQRPELQFVQFIDGDCTLCPTWLDAALAAIDSDHELAAVWGWRRERCPDRSIFNRICDLEWRIPPAGETRNFGGDALVRVAAYQQVGGYDANVVASEDLELSARLRAAGWRIRRLDLDMTLHDARMTRLSQWWRRCLRRGIGYAQMWERHRDWPQAAPLLRIFIWAIFVPILVVALAWPTRGISLALAVALYALRIARIA